MAWIPIDFREETHVWWGAIRSERQAQEVVSWTAWSLLLVGLAPLGALGLSAARGELQLSWPIWQNFGENWIVLGQIVFAFIEIAAAAVLLRTRSWVSAVILLACCVFVISVLVATMAKVMSGGDDGATMAGENGLLLVAMLFFARLIWRAMYATQEIRRLQLSEQFI
ncbi:MAG TPA: hypothetical protein VKQ70_08395 [Caulobacteraceae bacterium]|nr:hypothetical protein [Caulobacteraceae bacterium]